ncbi:ribosomal L37ae family protein, partial [Toxoplasma gondii ME49]
MEKTRDFLVAVQVGVVGKYGTRYGASLRKQVKKIELQQHAKYSCPFCGKVSAFALEGGGASPPTRVNAAVVSLRLRLLRALCTEVARVSEASLRGERTAESATDTFSCVRTSRRDLGSRI